jgi:hypothetical protein
MLFKALRDASPTSFQIGSFTRHSFLNHSCAEQYERPLIERSSQRLASGDTDAYCSFVPSILPLTELGNVFASEIFFRPLGAFAYVTLICPCEGNARFHVSGSRRCRSCSPSTGFAVCDILSERCSSLSRNTGINHRGNCDHARICLSCDLTTCIGHYAAAFRGQFANPSLVSGMHNVQPRNHHGSGERSFHASLAAEGLS